MTGSISNPYDVVNALEGLQKAVSSTSVVGLELVREDLQSEMAIQAPLDTPVRNRLARIPGNGKAHAFYRLEPKTIVGYGKFLGTGPLAAFFANGGLPTNDVPDYKYIAVPYAAVGDLAEVSFMDQAAGRSYQDLLQHQIRVKMLNTALCEEWCTINGDSSVHPLMYDGLMTQVTQSILYSSYSSYTDYQRFACVADACKQVYDNGGQSRFMVYSTTSHSAMVNSILKNFYAIRQMAGDASVADMSAGFNPASWDFGYGSISLLKSRYMLADEYSGYPALVIDDQSLDTVNNGNAVQMVDLSPMGSIELGLLQTARRVLIYEFTALMVSCPLFQMKIHGF
jgi:hypothetical protein